MKLVFIYQRVIVLIFSLFFADSFAQNLAQTTDHYAHPRLFFSTADESKLKERIKSDPLAAKIYTELIQRTDHILTLPTTKHYIKDGRRLLSESRYALRNILHTSMAWRLTKEKKYFDRAILELEAACSFKDWNPSHFLDTAEMSTAVAIGYDWLYNDLTEGQREQFSSALIKSGRDPARAGFIGSKKAWWSNLRNNWTQVCATGLLITERALEEKDEPTHKARLAAKDILIECRAFYLPDGGYPEGPSYWHYGSIYHVLGIAATQTNDKEMLIPTPPEFKRSALFPMQLTGPTGYVFNFADSGRTAKKSRVSVAQSWMVREFNDPSYVQYIRQKIEQNMIDEQTSEFHKLDRFFPLQLIWLPLLSERDTPPFALDSKWLGSQPVATFRTSWSDPDAMYLAIKGGLSDVSHGHMDVGSFVFESDGVRWVEDLGAENYNLPGYFSKGEPRWKFFRLTNLSHNTLVIGAELQDMNANTSPIIDFESTPDKAKVAFDISPAYSAQADQVIRKVNFNRKANQAEFTDTISSPKDSVRWAIITRANIEINDSVVTLKRNGKILKIVRNDKYGGVWKIQNATPPTTAENQNDGYRILSFTAPKAKKLELSVSFVPEK